MDLVIDKLVMSKSPQSGTWLFCFSATAGTGSATYHVPDKEYEGDPTLIEMGLRLSNVADGQTCSFTCNLDDDEGDVCGSSAEDRSSGSFTANKSGSQTFNPNSDWSYTLQWHME